MSDHILNLLEELEGKLPEDKEKFLGIIDRYFSMADEDRLIFRLGRRRGIYRSLDDLSDPYTYLKLKEGSRTLPARRAGKARQGPRPHPPEFYLRKCFPV